MCHPFSRTMFPKVRNAAPQGAAKNAMIYYPMYKVTEKAILN